LDLRQEVLQALGAARLATPAWVAERAGVDPGQGTDALAAALRVPPATGGW
jgi:hypothetical protein